MRTRSVQVLADKYQQGKLPATAQRALAEFLQMYGMRTAAEIDLGKPRWHDDPTPILQTLLSYLQIEDASLAPDVIFQRNKEQAERLAAEYIARARKTRFGWLRARLIGGITRRLRALSGLREVPLFFMVKLLGIYRGALLESARGLVARGTLERADDIFFIPLDTLQRFAQGEQVVLKDIAAANRATRIAQSSLIVLISDERRPKEDIKSNTGRTVRSRHKVPLSLAYSGNKDKYARLGVI